MKAKAGYQRGSLLLDPHNIIINDTGGTWVFVVSPDGETAVRRPIRLGRRNNRQVEIASGLREGERVIVSNYGGFGKVERLQIGKQPAR